MGVFSSGGIGIDLGSSNTVIFLEDEGVKLREPTCVLSMRENVAEALAVGKEAKQMLGRTGSDTVLVEPVIDGAVADCDLAALIMLALTEKAAGRRKPFEKSRLAVTMTQGATHVERNALEVAVSATGAKRSLIVKSPVAAALGAGVRFDKPRGVMMISIGAAVTEISVLSMYGVVAARTMKTGSLAFDEAIARYVRREKGLIIGLRTAQELKHDIGGALPPEGVKNEVVLRGRHVISGKPSTVPVNETDLYSALREPISVITDAICDALFNVPAELTGDILEDGIHLTGGGSLLLGLAERIREETKLSVCVSAEPADDAAKGVGLVASEERIARQLVSAYSAFEI